jgi:NAD dependent epimerase/dehydratase family enzyme
MKLILGEMAGMMLNGSKVSSAKIQKAGFQFKYLKLNEALKSLLKA